MEYSLPKDPAMLLSYVNTQLRNRYESLEEFCASQNIAEETIRDTLQVLDYAYDEGKNRFVQRNCKGCLKMMFCNFQAVFSVISFPLTLPHSFSGRKLRRPEIPFPPVWPQRQW